MQSPVQEALVVAVLLLNAYGLGANCVERFVNYQTWGLIPARAFQAYHKAQQPMIQAFVVAPMAAALILQIWLAFSLTSRINRWMVWVMIIASLVGALSTIMLQLPIHSAFNLSGYSPELMRRLLRSDWIRKVADAVRLVATVGLLHQLLSAR